MKKLIFIIILLPLAVVSTKAQDLDKDMPLIDIPEPVDSTQYNEAPDFPGGMEKMHQFIQSHIHAKIKDSGRVIVKFVIEKDGSLSEFGVVKSVSWAADNAVIQALRKSPKWKPGIQNGKAVRVQFTVPVVFQ